MPPRGVAIKELVKHLTDIADEYGNVPVITGNSALGAFESVEPPAVPTVTPTEKMTDFQTYRYAGPEAARRTKAALIN